MAENVSLSYVQILDSARLRYLLNSNEIDFNKVFEELNIMHSDLPSPNALESIEDLEKELADQKERYDNAVKFKYIISRLTLTRRMTPTLRYFITSIGHLINAERTAYQYLLNYFEMKKRLMTKSKNVRWFNNDWVENDKLDVYLTS